MKVSGKTGLGLAAAGLAAAVAIFAVYTASLDEATEPGQQNEVRADADDSALVSVSGGRLILPTQAGEPALIAFQATNPTTSHVYISEARLLAGGATELIDLGRVVDQEISKIGIPPGETLDVTPDSELAVLTTYGPSVVPGATVEMQLTFSDATTTRVPLMVESAIGQGGRVNMPEAIGAE